MTDLTIHPSIWNSQKMRDSVAPTLLATALVLEALCVTLICILSTWHYFQVLSSVYAGLPYLCLGTPIVVDLLLLGALIFAVHRFLLSKTEDESKEEETVTTPVIAEDPLPLIESDDHISISYSRKEIENYGRTLRWLFCQESEKRQNVKESYYENGIKTVHKIFQRINCFKLENVKVFRDFGQPCIKIKNFPGSLFIQFEEEGAARCYVARAERARQFCQEKDLDLLYIPECSIMQYTANEWIIAQKLPLGDQVQKEEASGASFEEHYEKLFYQLKMLLEFMPLGNLTPHTLPLTQEGKMAILNFNEGQKSPLSASLSFCPLFFFLNSSIENNLIAFPIALRTALERIILSKAIIKSIR